MPPSIPTSLNFGADPAQSRLLRWPKSVLGFLQGFYRRGKNSQENNHDHGDGLANDQHSHSSSSSHSSHAHLHPGDVHLTRSSRKASRVDAETPGHSGVAMSHMEVGFVYSEEEHNTFTQQQALINATEVVFTSVRPLLRMKSEDENGYGSSRILIIGRHADVRAEYLAHTCQFGLEAGMNPSDCVWPLVDGDGQIVIRDEQGVHWSEDIMDIHQLSSDDTFDVILIFSLQFNPSDMSPDGQLPQSTSSISSSSFSSMSSISSSSAKHLTQLWMEKLSDACRPGGCVAGIACLERMGSGTSLAPSTPSTSAFTPVQLSSSPAFTGRASTGSTSQSSSRPLAPISSSSLASPYSQVRTWRDRTEALGFFVHSAIDLGLEGLPVLREVEGEELTGPIVWTEENLIAARIFATKQIDMNQSRRTLVQSTPLVRSSSSGGSSNPSLGRHIRPINLSVLTGGVDTSSSQSSSVSTTLPAGTSSPALTVFTNNASNAHRRSTSVSPAPHRSPSPTSSSSHLPPTLNLQGLSASSPSPSPKLSPTESNDYMNMFSLTGGSHHSLMRRDGISPHSALSSARSSPSLTPSTPGWASAGPTLPSEPIVVSGVSLGLPNNTCPEIPIFSRLNIERLFDGVNHIEPTSAADKADIVSMNSCQISKDKVTGARVKTLLKDDKQLIQVLSKMAPRESWGLAQSYGLPSHVMEVLDATYELAVCAGLEALKDAGFDLKLSGVPPNELGLPESMRDETGVIFASSFPCLDSIVTEVTKKVRAETAAELSQQLNQPRPTDEDEKAKEYQYSYDRKLLFKLLVMANCQLAELIKARGPNMHINTACSGFTQAISIGEDWMRVGRCKRVIVIAADVATNPNIFKYLGTGFLSLGAASILPDPLNAAAPFDARRRGMILGAGATGMVLEYATSCLLRNVTPKVELVGSHCGNSAFHATLMDAVSISQQLNMFLKRLEVEKGLALADLPKELIYFSHETSTSANGGCAKVEMEALASIWPDDANITTSNESESDTDNESDSSSAVPSQRQRLRSQKSSSRRSILITNTKGLTGHPMAVGFEDVMSVESLARGLIPPVANFQKLDPKLEPLISPDQISRGGTHQRQYVLRMAGGFGNQFAYVLYRKWNEVNTLTWNCRLSNKHAQANVWSRLPGYYSYPIQISSNPNSTLVSRVNSEANLRRFFQAAGVNEPTTPTSASSQASSSTNGGMRDDQQ